MTRVRREVWAISKQPDDETLKWYAIGVAAMRARPLADHRSWRYQAAIHAYRRDRDPLQVPGEALPSQIEQDTFWTQCQHGSWFFLPWHRMYLHHFESIVRQDIVAAGGPADWALPYWDYSRADDPDEARSIPPAFRAAALPDGTANPLFVAQRSNGANEGMPIADDLAVDTAVAMEDQQFSDGPSSGAFGGPETAFMHGGDVIGKLEATPHGDIHVAVGGVFPFGWMSRFWSAALDPLFWLHHANIDRLWSAWLRLGQGRQNPRSDLWRETPFNFRNVLGEEVVMTSAEVENTTEAPLDYAYDDVPTTPFRAIRISPARPSAMTRQAKLVGATRAPFEVGGSSYQTVVPTHGARALMASASSAAPQRMFLQFEHLTSDEGASPYDVYVGVPDGEEPTRHPDCRIGRLPLFGLAEASSSEGPHAGSGLTYSIEITPHLTRLRALPGWDDARIPIALVPTQPSQQARVRVGRVGLYSE
jgi:tyrosinase